MDIVIDLAFIVGAAAGDKLIGFFAPYGSSFNSLGRPINQTTSQMIKVMSKFALPILIVAILFLLFSGNLLSPSPFVIAAQVLAVVLSFWARRSFHMGQFSIHAEPKEGPLMSTGPYQCIRHPMYAAALLLIWSSILGHLSILTVIIGLIVTGEVSIRIMVEEEFLHARFPDYAAYSRETKRIIPFLI